jgi:hypothetical protein
MELAAGFGSTDFCKSLRSISCPWDVRATAAAARNGHSDTLRFLHEEGCPWDVRAFINARILEPFDCADPLPVLQYWAEQGALSDPQLLLILLNWAGFKSKLREAVWPREQGTEWSLVLYSWDRSRDGHSVAVWPDEMVAGARANGCSAPTTVPQEEPREDLREPVLTHSMQHHSTPFKVFGVYRYCTVLAHFQLGVVVARVFIIDQMHAVFVTPLRSLQL